ncbi:MAG: Lrp/AsnC family transcriptional regulator [archaeon]|nr:Lrp/AsnC family transcriptional regulator [archaeon]
MASIMRIDDEVRLNILAALLKSGSVTANINQLQHHTGYHKATIKSSLDFLAKEGLLTGYGPKVDFKKFGYKLEVLSLLQADLTQEKFFEKFLKEVDSDPNLYSLSGLVGSGNYNLISRHIYRDIESYHEGVNSKYFRKLGGIHDFIKRRDIFYVTEPFYKMSSRTSSLIKIIRKSRGYDS